jgi:rSAM/selenodomain-associated transferase 1
MDHIGLFAKYWQPGRVKTRLAACLGDQIACELYQVFLFHFRDTLATTADRRCVAFSPADREAEFAGEFDGWDLEAQVDGDLGDRMRAFFERAFNNSKDVKETKVIVVGADCPHLSATEIRTAFSVLDRADVVLGPSNDGGYYLLGMKAVVVDVFSGIQWSTEKVLDQTISLLKQQGVGYQLLPPKTDIDDADALRQVIGELKRSDEAASTISGSGRNSLLCKKIESLLAGREL